MNRSKFDARAGGYFKRLSSRFFTSGVEIIAVAHMVENSIQFLGALDTIGHLRLILAKPNTAMESVRTHLSDSYPLMVLDRAWAADPAEVVSTLERVVSGPFVLVDIGAYFAPAYEQIVDHFKSDFLGVMEGTENGLAKYNLIQPISGPVMTVADSRLKYPENHLVGVSVAHSIEAVVRELNGVLQSRRACVIGFGKVGRSVADALRGRGVPVSVFDANPVPMAEAAARGYVVHRTLTGALRQANLVVGATGNHSLDMVALNALVPGTMVATVTSGDDEFAPGVLDAGWRKIESTTSGGTPCTEYQNRETRFLLLNNGHTINFLHGAVIGPAIQLIEGEKLAAVHALSVARHEPGIHHVSDDVRDDVARVWLDHFLEDSI